MIKNIVTILVCLLVLSFLYAFVVPNLARAAATMQNDTESIALPSSVSGGQTQVIFDNPDLIEQWAQGATNFTDYYANLGSTFTVTPQGTGVVSVGQDTTAATGASFVDFLGNESGVTYSPRSTQGVSNVGSNGSIVIVGSKLREALIKKGLLTISVRGWDFDDTSFTDDSAYYEAEAAFDSSDLAVVATAIVFRDQNIENVSIQGERLNVTYTARGDLFWFIPITFTVYLSINTSGTTDAERITLKYPWYRIFVALPVSPNTLAANLNASIIGMQAAKMNTEEAQARLFTYISNLLQAGGAVQVAGLPTQ
jgi:hypothetical protein